MRVLSLLMLKGNPMIRRHRLKLSDQLEVDFFSDRSEFMGSLPNSARRSQSLTLSTHAIFVTYAVKRLNIIKILVMHTDFSAQPLNMTVNRPII